MLPGSALVQLSNQSWFSLGGEPVDIQQDFPFGIGLAKFLERRPPPEAARIICILPEIVEEPAAPVT